MTYFVNMSYLINQKGPSYTAGIDDAKPALFVKILVGIEKCML